MGAKPWNIILGLLESVIKRDSFMKIQHAVRSHFFSLLSKYLKCLEYCPVAALVYLLPITPPKVQIPSCKMVLKVNRSFENEGK